MLPSITMSPALVAAVVALTLPLAGCDQAPSPTASDLSVPSAASARVVRADGAFVIRGSVPGALLMVDFDRERTLVVGHTAAQLADICTTGVPPEEVTEQDVFTPNGVLHLLVKARSLPAVVWSVLSFDPCGELQGVEPLAEGSADAVYTDNDYFDSGRGAGSFGLTARGRLTETATGLPVKLDAKFRNVLLPDGTIKAPVVDIILR
jgi:hypothetical protein